MKSFILMLGFVCLGMMIVISVFIAQNIVERPASIATRPVLARETDEERQARAEQKFREWQEDRTVRLNLIHHNFTDASQPAR